MYEYTIHKDGKKDFRYEIYVNGNWLCGGFVNSQRDAIRCVKREVDQLNRGIHGSQQQRIATA